MIDLSREKTLEVLKLLEGTELDVALYIRLSSNHDIEVYVDGPTIHNLPYRLHFDEYVERGSHSFWSSYKSANKAFNEHVSPEISRKIGRLIDPKFSDEIFDLAISLREKLDKTEADYQKTIANADIKRNNTFSKVNKQFQDALKGRSK